MYPEFTFHPLSSPLSSRVLIEASAGTGKTYTITTLILRLLLNINSPYATALTLDEILIVTFTNAATAELKKRIYERIVAMRYALIYGTEDPGLLEIVAALKGQEHASCQRLILAERAIDSANIFTIHAFCQRLLMQSALESRLPFSFNLSTSLNKLFLKAAQQFWRKYCYRFDEILTGLAHEIYQSPEKLTQKLFRYLNHPEIRISTEIPASLESLTEYFSNQKQKLETLKQLWQQYVHEIPELIAHSDVNKRSYSKKNLPNWIEAVNLWAQHQHDITFPSALTQFSQMALEASASLSPPHHLLFTRIDEVLIDCSPELTKEILLQFARIHINIELDILKKQEECLGFDDIIFLTHQLVENPPSNIQSKLNTAYKVAMIDEFQDTDQQQYDIFNNIFSADTQRLLMIGDPKQSIYKFRGADIYAYLTAKFQTSAQYTLTVNYRSGAQVVDGVNHLFSRTTNPFLEKDIPFIPITTPDYAQTQFIEIDQVRQKGLLFYHVDSSLSGHQYYAQLAEQTACEVKELLEKGTIHEGDNTRLLMPQDIALIVRKGHEARLLKKSLAKLKINTVYLSEKTTIYSTTTAQDFLLFLKSLLHPRDHMLIRRIFASPLYQFNLAELKTVLEYHEQYEHYILERNTLIGIWDKHGVLAMLRAFLVAEQRFTRIKNSVNGERYLTDLLHLGESLQTQSPVQPTKEALLLWFENTINHEQYANHEDTEQLRLEREWQTVTIITIHKSKGLEFPIVLIPFALTVPKVSDDLYHDPKAKHTYLSFQSTPAISAQIRHEYSAEEVRLLYVALTRAKYHCRIGTCAVLTHRNKGITHETSLGRLLNLTKAQDQIQAFSHPSIGWKMIHSDPMQMQVAIQPINNLPTLKAAQLKRPIQQKWFISSFSQLTRLVYQEHSFNNEKIDEHSPPDELSISSDLLPCSIHTFPKGADVGTFIHRLFEQYLPSELIEPETIATAIKQSILAHKLNHDLGTWSIVLAQWLKEVLNTELAPGLTLCSILSHRSMHELPFLFPVQSAFKVQDFNALLNQQSGRKFPAQLDFSTFQGQLKGFIDLIFEWQGKYYIIDYKTNHLGDKIQDYHPERLQQVIDVAYYDAQYLIYTVALTRFLTQRQPEFNYERDFGGIYYLFVRGMHPEETSGIYFTKPDAQLMAAFNALFGTDHYD